jgi:hypothetical protein
MVRKRDRSLKTPEALIPVWELFFGLLLRLIDRLEDLVTP